MLLPLLLTICLFGSVWGGKVTISSTNQFQNFMRSYNAGNRYVGSTVVLEIDVDFSVLSGIKWNSQNPFRGTFDGQGNIINNFEMDAASENNGFFSSVESGTIKNVVFQNSKITYGGTQTGEVQIGGVVGLCKDCTVENVLSTTSIEVSFDGNANQDVLILGGIVGRFFDNGICYVKNCANYGSITIQGPSSTQFIIGGIVGFSNSYETGTSTIKNSLFAGGLTYNPQAQDTSFDSFIGGITGYATKITIHNCVNDGVFQMGEGAGPIVIGGISGTSYRTRIKNCYWAGSFSPFSSEDKIAEEVVECASFNSNYELENAVYIGNQKISTLIEALSIHADDYELFNYSRWVLNRDRKNMVLIDNEESISMNHKLIILPRFSKEGYLFGGWVENLTTMTYFTANEITSDANLYYTSVVPNVYTITFDSRGGEPVEPITYIHGDPVTLLAAPGEKEGHVFVAWETVNGVQMPAEFTAPGQNLTLYAKWLSLSITSPEELIEFSTIVNNGLSLQGKTISLDADIEFTDELSMRFKPIGGPFDNSFRGTFHGNGHTISNLKMRSSGAYYGLFGVIGCSTVEGVIIDDSCSFESNSTVDGNEIYMGGIVGQIYSSGDYLGVENCVNMAPITFGGSTGVTFYIGGIVGSSTQGKTLLSHSANYGSITSSGPVNAARVYVGGVIGHSRIYEITGIHDVLNAGDISCSGKVAKASYIGGIAGRIELGFENPETRYVQNAVCYGSIATDFPADPTLISVGAICGGASGIEMTNAYWVGNDGLYSIGSESEVTKTNTSKTDLDSMPMDTLNEYLDKRSIWVLNKNNASITFKIDDYKGFTINAGIFLLPTPFERWYPYFYGWYADEYMLNQVTSIGVESDTTLYGVFGNMSSQHTISFVSRSEEYVAPVTGTVEELYYLPTPGENGTHEFVAWETAKGDTVPVGIVIPPRNITLYGTWIRIYIRTPDEFIEFANNVNNGITSYEGRTVYLDADIEFTDEHSKQLKPIGSYDNHFCGIFDGMGHTISGLKVNSTGPYTGLFGFNMYGSYKNVVIDDSCSFLSSYLFNPNEYNAAYASSLIGASMETLSVASCVNMAPITFSGNTSVSYVGGLVASSDVNDLHITNCANYGTLSNDGTSWSSAYMGGIVGGAFVLYSSLITSVFNAGGISFTGSVKDEVAIGGFSGIAQGLGNETSFVSYFMSYGTITNKSKTTPMYTNIGTIIGDSHGIIIGNCYWLPNNNNLNANGYEYKTKLTETYQVPQCSDAVDKMNAGFNMIEWLHNKNNASVTFKINDYKGFTLKSGIISLLRLESTRTRIFNGWYKDELLTELQMTSDIDADTTLYAIYCGLGSTVTFDVNGGDELQEKEATIPCNGTYERLPTPTRTESTFLGWYTEREGGVQAKTGKRIIILGSHTLYAHWSVNKYIATFDFDNGTVITTEYEYNETIKYPAVTAIKPKHTFSGWNSDLEFMPATNVTIIAVWEPIYYTVMFDFGEGYNPMNRRYMEGDAIEYPMDETRGNLVLVRWEPQYETMPAHDFTTLPVWAQEESVVTFILHSGLSVNTTFKYNEKVVFPGKHETEGAKFEGWFLDSTFETPFVGPYVEKDCVLYGKYTVTPGGGGGGGEEGDNSEDAASFLGVMPALMYAALFWY